VQQTAEVVIREQFAQTLSEVSDVAVDQDISEMDLAVQVLIADTKAFLKNAMPTTFR